MTKKVILIIGVVILILLAGWFYLANGIPWGFKNGHLVVLKYSQFCSDYCPPEIVQKSGSWDVWYPDVRSKEECEKIGGAPFIDPAWQGYHGCRAATFAPAGN